MSVLQILESIGSDSKRTHKISVISQNRGNDLFMKVANLALNPYVQFYIRKIPDYDAKGGKTLDWALVELEKLSERILTGNDAAEHLRSILSSLNNDDAIVVTRIIGKDLRCGASDGTFNDAITGFIPTYPCLLARPYDEKNIKNIKYPAYSQLKADGLRANAIVEGHKVQLCGRSGREIDLLGALDVHLSRLAMHFPWPVVFDGEFVVVDANEGIIDRKTGNGIINKAIKGTIDAKEARQVRFQIWDAIPLHEFKQGASSESYRTRFERLVSVISSKSESWHPYWVIPYQVVNNLDEAITHFELLLSQGHEGTILKNMTGIWSDTRSKDLVKMKAEKDVDLEVIGYNPGEGKFTDMVGSLICATSDRKVEVAISGFSDELRAEITRDINRIIGTIVTVCYNERISSKSSGRVGVDSLFLPRFQEFRSDKTIANSSLEVK
jgi:hypothetical protein